MQLVKLVVAFAFVLVVSACFGARAQQLDTGRSGGVQPPSIEYGGTRESSHWVETPGGIGVAVDQGVEWEGVKVYLSLTGDLVAVDAATGKARWSKSVGMFWSRLAIEDAGSGWHVWVIALRPGTDEENGADAVQYHELRTGDVVRPQGRSPEPAGRRLEPSAAASGDGASLAEAFRSIAVTPESWAELQSRMFGPHVPLGVKELPVDWSRELVLVVYEGATTNCSGLECGQAWEDEARILIRLHHLYYQSLMDTPTVHPYGIFVLPKLQASSGTYIVERNVQSYIGAPPIWREDARLCLEPAAPAEPERERIRTRSRTTLRGQ